jgi:hypothetical protein
MSSSKEEVGWRPTVVVVVVVVVEAKHLPLVSLCRHP